MSRQQRFARLGQLIRGLLGRAASTIRAPYRDYRRLQRARKRWMRRAQKQIEEGEDVTSSLEELHRLQELGDLRRRRFAWLALLIPLAILFLGLLPAETTEIAMDLRLSALGFTVRQPADFVSSLGLEEVGITTVTEARLPSEPGEEAVTIGGDGGSHRLRVTKLDPGSSLELAALSLAPGTSVRVQELPPGPARYLISLRGPDLADLKLNLKGELEYVSINMEANPPRPRRDRLDLPWPAPLRLEPHPRSPLDLVLDLEDIPVRPLAQHLQIADLELLLPRDPVDTGAGFRGQLVSTLISGTLYYDELGGRGRPLRRGDILRLELQDDRGDVTFLGFDEDGHLILRFQGPVTSLKVGRSEVDLMPLRIEVWNANSRLTLYLTVLAALATFVTALRS